MSNCLYLGGIWTYQLSFLGGAHIISWHYYLNQFWFKIVFGLHFVKFPPNMCKLLFLFGYHQEIQNKRERSTMSYVSSIIVVIIELIVHDKSFKFKFSQISWILESLTKQQICDINLAIHIWYLIRSIWILLLLFSLYAHKKYILIFFILSVYTNQYVKKSMFKNYSN